MATVTQAKELAKTAVIKVSKMWDDSISVIFGGAVEANLELELKIPNEANVDFTVFIPAQRLDDMTTDSITIHSLASPILNCLMIEASADEIDTTKFPLGYYNQYDQPETMEKWISNPDHFMLSLVDYLTLIKDFIRDEVLKSHSLDL